MQKKYGLDHIFKMIDLSEKKCEITLEWATIAMNYYLEQIAIMEAEHG
jgi:hypothetical protein